MALITLTLNTAHRKTKEMGREREKEERAKPRTGSTTDEGVLVVKLS